MAIPVGPLCHRRVLVSGQQSWKRWHLSPFLPRFCCEVQCQGCCRKKSIQNLDPLWQLISQIVTAEWHFKTECILHIHQEKGPSLFFAKKKLQSQRQSSSVPRLDTPPLSTKEVRLCWQAIWAKSGERAWLFSEQSWPLCIVLMMILNFFYWFVCLTWFIGSIVPPRVEMFDTSLTVCEISNALLMRVACRHTDNCN